MAHPASRREGFRTTGNGSAVPGWCRRGAGTERYRESNMSLVFSFALIGLPLVAAILDLKRMREAK